MDESLTRELFGYNVAEEPPASWTPEKLAVLLTRRLNVQIKSPLHGRVLVAPKRGPGLDALTRDAGWHVSTAVVVEEVMKLYSSNPKRNSSAILQFFTRNATCCKKLMNTNPPADVLSQDD